MEINRSFNAPFGDIPALRLSFVPRWSIIKMAKNQSVAEHCFNMSRIIMYLHKKGLIPDNDVDGYIKEALCHDDDEIFTGDIPSPAKKNNLSCTSDIVKLADILESLRFFEENCIDSDYVKRWVRYSLRTALSNKLNLLRIEWYNISSIIGE